MTVAFTIVTADDLEGKQGGKGEKNNSALAIEKGEIKQQVHLGSAYFFDDEESQDASEHA